jgi:hypothetical protein
VVAEGVFAPGHLGELTRIVPFEMVDAVLAETGAVRNAWGSAPCTRSWPPFNPLARLVIGAVRLRRGKAADVHGAKSFIAQALAIRRTRAESESAWCGRTANAADVAAACHRPVPTSP